MTTIKTDHRTVEEAVLDVIINALRSGTTSVKIWDVETAHANYRMSGRARIRGLKQKGLIRYRHDRSDNTYVVETPLRHLIATRDEIKDKRRGQGEASQPVKPVESERPVTLFDEGDGVDHNDQG